jgi:hypothetical protein
VGLFPRLVSAFMAVLLGWRIIDSVRHGGLRAPGKLMLPSMALFTGTLSLPLAIGLLLVYALLTYVFGLVISTAVFLVGAPWLMGYGNRKAIVAITVGGVVVLVLVSRALGILVPAGILGRLW